MCCLHLLLQKNSKAILNATQYNQKVCDKLQAGVTDCYYYTIIPVCNMACRRFWEAIKMVNIYTNIQLIGQQIELFYIAWILLAERGNYAETVAAPCGCTQLLISVCMGLYRPEMRIQ